MLCTERLIQLQSTNPCELVPGVTSIGGRTRCSRKKMRKKGIQIRGGRGTRKGCQNREKWGERVSKSL